MKTVKVTLEVFLDADGVDEAELRAAEGHTIDTVVAATKVALGKEYLDGVEVYATGHAIVERSVFDLETGRRLR